MVAGSLYLVGAARARLVDDPELRDPDRRGPGVGSRTRCPGRPTPPSAPRDRLARPVRRADATCRSQRGVVPPDPDRGGGAATPSFAVPSDVGSGLPGRPAPLAIGPRTFAWGTRTFVMGILNVTPDSFSGDGLIAAGGDPVAAAVAQARSMVAEGADLLDVGGESPGPGHAAVSAPDEIARVVPVIRAAAGGAAGDAPLRRHDEAGRRRRGAGSRRPPAQRRLGGRRGRRACPGRRRPRRPADRDAQPGRGTLREPGRGDPRRPPACPGAGARRGRRLGPADRRPRVRLRQGAAPQPGPASGPRVAPAPGPAGPARDVSQVDAGQGARPPPDERSEATAGDHGPRHRRRRGHRAGPRRACERARRTDGRRGGARLGPGRSARDRPDRAARDALRRPPRRAPAGGASRRQPFDVDVVLELGLAAAGAER